jgi:chaperonin GroES
MLIKPIRDRILVKPAPAETKTASGFFIPDTANEGPVRGTVVQTGGGRVAEDGTVIALVITEGDNIMYLKGAGQPVKVNDEDHIILTEDQILAIVE